MKKGSEFENYKYIVYQKDDASTVVMAESTFAGKKVYGRAICSPVDEFDLEFGKDLAAKRCAKKVQEKRIKYFKKLKDLHTKDYEEFSKWYEKRMEFLNNKISATEEDLNKLKGLC